MFLVWFMSSGINKIRYNKKSGIVSLLWMKRALDFILQFLEKLMITGLEKTSYDNAREAYEFVLKPYHGWLVANIVIVAFNLCPTREQLRERLGFTGVEDSKEKVQKLLDVARYAAADVANEFQIKKLKLQKKIK
eukprot:GHVT01090428.1.p1 GENE.GHVT01090428.1~~GHVT01090428.1.p1  ORF type:complete len:135 (-),score=20.58 GHVT01090428.1:247-651(-)